MRRIETRVTLSDERVWNTPNLITFARLAGCLVIFGLAYQFESPALNFIGLGVHWFLDMLDGHLARTLNQETLFGAQIDILSDRFLTAFFYFNYLTTHAELIFPVAIFLVIFMVLDNYLSLQFLRWGLLSPNYFDHVDLLIWRLNWSPAGKFTNSGLVTILLVTFGNSPIVLLVVVGLIVLKMYTGLRMHQLPLPAVWSRFSPPSGGKARAKQYS